MNAILKAKQDEAAAWIERAKLPQDWRSARAEAAKYWLLENGAAHKRDHFWSYTDPSLAFGDAQGERAELPQFEGVNLTDQMNSAGEGFEIIDLSKANGAIYGDIVARAHEKGARPFAEKSLLSPEGLVLNISGNAGVFVIDYSKFAGNFLRINLAKGASFTLIERIDEAQNREILIEADLADEAQFDHIRVAPKMDDRLMLQLFADLDAGADLRSFNLVAPSKFRRFESIVNLNGEHGHVSIAGANLLRGASVHDDTVYITHNAAHCTSRQVFKRVVAKDAQSIFQGKIFVKEGAQKTDGYQISQGLMLEDGGEVLSKPELEIYADDVACSHGSTTSGLDETALFYLRSRGVPMEMAEQLLTRAFIQEAFEELRDEDLSGALEALAETWIFGQPL